MTASLPIANEIASRYSLDSDIRLILAGGAVRARELSMVGHYAEQIYRDMHVDKAFVGAAGLITNRSADKKTVAGLQDMGIEVIFADPE